MMIFAGVVVMGFSLIFSASPASASIFPEDGFGNNNFQELKLALGKVNFCPNEYSRDARLKYGNEMNNFKIGEQEIIECGSADGSIRYNLDNYPSQFIVYPSPSRECLVDGEWSRPRPICAYNISIKVDEKRSEVQPIAPSLSCSIITDIHDECSDNWIAVGKPYRPITNQSLEDDYKEEIFDCVYYFRRPYYLSYIILKLMPGQVIAHSDDHIIKNFTSEAKKFRDEHFPADWYKTGGSTNNNEWPVVEVSVYADRLRVRYSIIRRINPSEQSATAENKCGPAKVKIFRILEARYSVANKEEPCPSPPLIANASKFEPVSEGKSVLFYSCESDEYVLTDGRSKQVLLNNATITCVEGVWVPNPFPICIPGGIQERIENDIILNTKENGTNPMVNESHCRGDEKDEMTPLSTMKILSEIQHQLYALTVVVILQFVTLILVACFIATRLRSLVVPITQKASPVAARRSSQRGSDQFGTPRSRSSTHNYGGEKDEALTLALSLTDIKNAEERILNEDVCSQWQSLEVTRQRRPNSETKL